MDIAPLSDRALSLLNGHSVRPIRSGRLIEGDRLFGTVVERRHGNRGDSLVIRLQEPGIFSGQRLDTGDGLRINCGVGVLRRLVVGDDPQPGDLFAVQCEERVGGRPELVAGVEKATAVLRQHEQW